MTFGASVHRESPDAHHPEPARLLWWRRVVVVAFVLVVLSPALRNRDSFPLSTYPVYASVRDRDAVIDTAFGEAADGTEHRLSMNVIAGTDDPLIAEQRVSSAIDTGRADDLCTRIASRVGADVTAVVVVREVHDVVRAASGEESLGSRSVEARCEVRR